MKGKINVIAKTGGVKVEGDENWYNPASPEVRDFLLSNKESLLNSEANLLLNNEGKIERVSVERDLTTSIKQTEEKPMFLDRETKIIRQNVLGHATKVVMEMYEKTDEVLTTEQLIEKIIEIAGALEQWVNR